MNHKLLSLVRIGFKNIWFSLFNAIIAHLLGFDKLLASFKPQLSKFSLLILLLLSGISTCFAGTNYYLSNAGNDSNNGTAISSPWRSLEKLSSLLGGTSGTWGSISNGDSIFFRRGDVFRGTIAFSAYNNNGISFGAYGVGTAPIIKGSMPVIGWTLHASNIWKATVSQKVYFVYLNEALQKLARYPNSGTLNIVSATANSITTPLIGASGFNFVGANLCLREHDWRLNRQRITNQSGNVLSWNNNIDVAANNANFYLDNSLVLLDTIGEWFYDDAQQSLYLKTNLNPNLQNIEASIHLLGIAGNDNRSQNIVQNLQFRHYADGAIRLMGAANQNIIRNCTFHDNLSAIFISGTNNTVVNNEIIKSYLEGIVAANMANSTIESNTIQDVGLDFGHHRPNFVGSFYSAGIWLIMGNPGCKIRYNLIKNIGYNGIRFGGNGIQIAYNRIQNVVLNMDDGGAIYTFGAYSYNCQIHYNSIKDVWGDKNGVRPAGIVLGIYIDNFAHHMDIIGNTMQNIPVGSGILINAGSHNNLIRENTTYLCREGITFADWQAGASVYANTLDANVFYANKASGIPIMMASDDNSYSSMVSASNNNFLCNPLDTSKIIQYIWSQSQTFSLPAWTTLSGLDNLSAKSFYQWTPPNDRSFIVINESAVPQTYTSYGSALDLNNQLASTFTLPAFRSKVLISQTLLSLDNARLSGFSTRDGNLLKWTTVRNQNFLGFEVQKSIDKMDFEKIGFVYSNQTSNTSFDYSFVDKKPSSNQVVYYRLKKIKLDGQYEYSNLITLAVTNSARINIYPNPVVQMLTIENAQGQATIYNVLGQIIRQTNITSPQYLWNLSDLPKGVYTLQVQTPDQSLPVIRQFVR